MPHITGYTHAQCKSEDQQSREGVKGREKDGKGETLKEKGGGEREGGRKGDGENKRERGRGGRKGRRGGRRMRRKQRKRRRDRVRKEE